MKIKNASKITTLPIIIWIIIYFITDLTRKYLLGSGPGTIDNYVNIGYGQTFPETTFQYHYYKESRLLTIIWVSITNNLNLEMYTFASLSMSLFTSLIVLKLLWEKYPKNRAHSLGFAVMLTLSPFLWGEYVGGSDNYNQIGNLIVALYIRYCFINIDLIGSSGIQKFVKNENVLSRKLIIIGFGTFVVINEIPTGIFVFLISALVFLRLNIRKLLRKKTNFKMFLAEIFLIFTGFITALLFYTVFFMATSQNAERSVSGLKFILTNIRDPQIQLSYFLPLHDSLVWKSSVATTIILSIFLLGIVLLNKIKRISFAVALNDFEHAYLIVIFYLLGAQIFEKNIVFGSTLPPGYFLSPILLSGCIIFALRIFEILNQIGSNLSNKFLGKDFIGLLSLAGMGFLLNLTWLQVAICILFSSISLLTQELFRKPHVNSVGKSSIKGSYEFLGNKSFVTQTLICVIVLSSLIFSPSQNLQCDSFYYLKKQDALRIAESIDQNAGKRGTIYMGADSSVIDLEMDFRGCETFKYIKLADYLYAISAMGFIPVDQVPLRETSENMRSDWNYQQNRLALIDLDPKSTDSCTVVWSLHPSKVITFLDIDGKRIFGNLSC